MELKNAVLVDGVRSPFARGARGKLVATRLDDAGATILRGLLDRNPLVSDSMIEDFGLGMVVGPTEFSYIGTVAKLAGLAHEVCTFNVNRQCGSSMEAVHRIAMQNHLLSLKFRRNFFLFNLFEHLVGIGFQLFLVADHIKSNLIMGRRNDRNGCNHM